MRAWIYVNDYCEAILQVLKNGKISEIYNIGGVSEIKNIDLVKKILKILGETRISYNFY